MMMSLAQIRKSGQELRTDGGDNEFIFKKVAFMILWGISHANTSRLLKY